MTKNRIKGLKYNKISQQQKFILLHSILKDRHSINQAAIKAKMNYSTAKAIFFFYKHNQKTYFNRRVEGSNKMQQNPIIEAGYIQKKNIKSPLLYGPISIISSVITNNSAIESRSQKLKKHIGNEFLVSNKEIINASQSKQIEKVKQQA